MQRKLSKQTKQSLAPYLVNNRSSSLTFLQLRIANVERQIVCFPYCKLWNSTDWALALGGEIGEVVGAVKRLRRTKSRDSKRRQLRKEILKEIADVVTYCDLFAFHLGADLGAVVRDKYNEVSNRNGHPEFEL